MSILKYSVGIDLAKASFKACLTTIDENLIVKVKSTSTFSNSIEGFSMMIKWVAKNRKDDRPLFFLMEATGIYYEQLAWLLFKKQFNVSVILPNKSKRYMQSLGLKSKNDKIDAQGLSYMNAQQSLPLWEPLTESFYTLRSLTRHLESLQTNRTALNNQLHAAEHSMYNLGDLKKSLKQTISHIDKQIKKISTQIEKMIKKDTILCEKYTKISKVKGIGLLTFAVIAGETNGFLLFENSRQLVSYAGYDVVENQSGNITGKTRISKKGNSHIRRALHMPALITVKNNELAYKNLYERIYDRTNIKMKGYVAIQKKLLCLIYSLWKNNAEFDPEYYKRISENQEPKSLFPVDSERILKKEVAPVKALHKMNIG